MRSEPGARKRIDQPGVAVPGASPDKGVGEEGEAVVGQQAALATAVGAGSPDAEITAWLFMSKATVKAHVSRLLSKLDVANRVQVPIVVHEAFST